MTGVEAIWRFSVDMLLGVLMFAVMAGAAMAVDFMLHWLGRHGFSGDILRIISSTGELLLLIDCLLLLFYSVRTTYQFVQATVSRE